MSEEIIEHTGEIWTWNAQEKGAWHFLTIDGSAGDALAGIALMRGLETGRRGFGSLKVEAQIARSVWRTSVFPDKKRGFLLPLKMAIRKAEGLREGERVAVRIQVL